MNPFKRRHKDTAQPEYTVQLHRVNDKGKVLGSWAPRVVRGQAAAEQVAANLRRDNRWGGHNNWPHVTIREGGVDERGRNDH